MLGRCRPEPLGWFGCDGGGGEHSGILASCAGLPQSVQVMDARMLRQAVGWGWGGRGGVVAGMLVATVATHVRTYAMVLAAVDAAAAAVATTTTTT